MRKGLAGGSGGNFSVVGSKGCVGGADGPRNWGGGRYKLFELTVVTGSHLPKLDLGHERLRRQLSAADSRVAWIRRGSAPGRWADESRVGRRADAEAPGPACRPCQSTTSSSPSEHRHGVRFEFVICGGRGRVSVRPASAVLRSCGIESLMSASEFLGTTASQPCQWLYSRAPPDTTS